MNDWYDKKYPKRKRLRLQGYDYSRNGAYFVTICTIDRLPLLGDVVVGADDPVRPYVELTEIGKIISDCWDKIDFIYENVRTNAFCIMPNHIHGIIVIDDSGGQSRPPLQKIIQGFKSVTTRMCFDMDCHKIWQRSYHDRIIRDQEEYIKIRKYINENPENWLEDCYYE
jgi:REP element-mobilizing transposase RayT